MKKILSILLFTCALSTGAFAQNKNSHYQAAEKLLTAMNTEQAMNQAMEQMLSMQVKQNPMMQQYEDIVRDFFKKYASWEALKEPYIQLYMSEFSEKELQEITRFYQTEVGKKMAAKQPVLVTKGAEISQKSLETHLPELQQAIQKRSENR
jgi:uncharacterized protein